MTLESFLFYFKNRLLLLLMLMRLLLLLSEGTQIEILCESEKTRDPRIDFFFKLQAPHKKCINVRQIFFPDRRYTHFFHQCSSCSEMRRIMVSQQTQRVFARAQMSV